MQIVAVFSFVVDFCLSSAMTLKIFIDKYRGRNSSKFCSLVFCVMLAAVAKQLKILYTDDIQDIEKMIRQQIKKFNVN